MQTFFLNLNILNFKQLKYQNNKTLFLNIINNKHLTILLLILEALISNQRSFNKA